MMTYENFDKFIKQLQAKWGPKQFQDPRCKRLWVKYKGIPDKVMEEAAYKLCYEVQFTPQDPVIDEMVRACGGSNSGGQKQYNPNCNVCDGFGYVAAVRCDNILSDYAFRCSCQAGANYMSYPLWTKNDVYKRRTEDVEHEIVAAMPKNDGKTWAEQDDERELKPVTPMSLDEMLRISKGCKIGYDNAVKAGIIPKGVEKG